jgi:hypothetical protein
MEYKVLKIKQVETGPAIEADGTKQVPLVKKVSISES